MRKIFKTQQAEQDLIDIWLYTYQEWGEIQADKYLDCLNESLQILQEEPRMCRERKEFYPAVRIYRYLEHLIIYIIAENDIRIICILHKSMDIESSI